MLKKNISNKKDIQKKLLLKQLSDIENLKKKISELELQSQTKNDIVHSVEAIHEEFIGIVNDLRDKREKYDELIAELQKMKEVMNKKEFKGRWKLIKWLMK